eukprot:1682739-Amphidinium_carterae.9
MKGSDQDWSQPQAKEALAGSSGADQHSRQRLKGNKQRCMDSDSAVEVPDTGGAASSGTQQKPHVVKKRERSPPRPVGTASQSISRGRPSL